MINKDCLSKQIFDDLVVKVRKKLIRQGERLVVSRLQAEYGVSSSPIRDALSLMLR